MEDVNENANTVYNMMEEQKNSGFSVYLCKQSSSVLLGGNMKKKGERRRVWRYDWYKHSNFIKSIYLIKL